MAKPIWNCNGGAAIVPGSGNFCPIIVGVSITGFAGQQSSDMIDLASYIFTTGGTATGTITFQELAGSSISSGFIWNTLATPAPIVLGAATSYSGVINGPFHGLRMVVTSLAVANILYAELKGSVRSM